MDRIDQPGPPPLWRVIPMIMLISVSLIIAGIYIVLIQVPIEKYRYWRACRKHGKASNA